MIKTTLYTFDISLQQIAVSNEIYGTKNFYVTSKQ